MSSTSADDYSYFLYVKDAQNYIGYLISAVIFPISFALNIISVLFIYKQTFSGLTIRFYFVLSAITNNLVILINFFVYLTKAINNDITLWSNFWCAFFQFGRMFAIYSAWLQIMVTFDRLIKIGYPHRFQMLANIKFLSAIAGVLFIGSLVLALPNLFFRIQTITIYDTVTSKFCLAPSNIQYLRDQIMFFTRAALPIIFILILDILLIYKLKKAKLYFLNNNELKKEYYFAYSVAAFNIFFILSQIPNVICLLIMSYVQNSGFSMISKVYVYANLAVNMSLIITLFSYCCSFFTNLKFNILFRNEVLIFFYELKNWL